MEMTHSDWLVVITSAFSGLLGGVLFARLDSRFVKFISAIIPTTMPFLGFWAIGATGFDNPLSIIGKSYLFGAISWICGFIAQMIPLYFSGKKRGLRLYHLITGSHLDFLAKSEELDIEQANINRDKEKLDKDKEIHDVEVLALRSQQDYFNNDKNIFLQHISEHKNSLSEQKSIFLLNVISSYPVLMSKNHVDSCVKNNRSICKAISWVRPATDQFSKTLEENIKRITTTKEQVQSILDDTHAYLVLVATYLNKFLFSHDGARVHFRIKAQNDNYTSVVAVHGVDSSSWENKLTDIPFINSLIEKRGYPLNSA